MSNTTRLLFISDLHCGALSGLTPNEYIIRYDKDVERAQKDFWNWYVKTVNMVNPDTTIVMGDCIEGQSKRSHGVGCVTSDLDVQTDMAIRALNVIPNKNIRFIRGTDYHVLSNGSEAENVLARHFDAPVNDHCYLTLKGKETGKLVFDLKHKVGGSSVPHGIFTPQAKETVWNTEWYIDGGAPLADVYIRGHVHRFSYCGTSRYLAINLPAMSLRAFNHYGSKCCSGLVDTGMVVFNINKDTATIESWYNLPYNDPALSKGSQVEEEL